MKRFIYEIYKKTEKNRIVASMFHFMYDKMNTILKGKYRPACYEPENLRFKQEDIQIPKEWKDIRITTICDQMTFDNLKESFKVSYLTPDNWITVMQETKPNVFFCEATWSGISQYPDAWRGKIYKNRKLIFENRKVLIDILDYCHRANIKTVFWNKEDPFYFDDECHDFSETAILFDYVFTTAEECVKKYNDKGCNNVFVMGFGFSPAIFHCPKDVMKENHAVFAGSWYADHLERCKDTEKILDMILERGIPLSIYDRQWGSVNPVHQFPAKYKPYIHKAVEYRELAEIYQKARFAININTEKDSDTMYARRVHELMACKCVVISNESKAMKKRFGNRVWFLNESFDLDNEMKICEENYQYVMTHFSNEVLYREMLEKIGITVVMPKA